jgi:hypothetical protein
MVYLNRFVIGQPRILRRWKLPELNTIDLIAMNEYDFDREYRYKIEQSAAVLFLDFLVLMPS